MTITFLCPNGHQLSAPPAMAGKTGKCPRCSTTFTVPLPDVEGAEVAEVSVEDAAGKSGKQQASPPSDLFVFLCPNGHRLNGPPSLKGKAGKCPHCGSTFQIPTDEEESSEGAESTATVDPLTASGEFAFNLKSQGHKPTKPASAPAATGPKIDSGFFSIFKGSGSGKQQAQPAPVAAEEPAPASEEVSTASPAQIFKTLWQSRTEDTELEIFLIEGEIFAPDYFSEALSTGEHGVFASKESGGKLSITVIPWESVRRISMQHLSKLPEGLFES
ncbi:MAG: hypothetical protein ACO1RA_20550 [Planctomycetaceae bacterium]